MEHSADVGFVGLTFDAEPARPLPVRGSQRRAGRRDERRRGASDLRPAWRSWELLRISHRSGRRRLERVVGCRRPSARRGLSL